jgi:hypothetical protein
MKVGWNESLVAKASINPDGVSLTKARGFPLKVM